MSLSTFLVEDNPVIREHLVSAMEDLIGAKIVAQVETEADAIDWIQAHPRTWTLAVVDLFLREGSGLGVVWACRNHSAPTKVVVLPTMQRQTLVSGVWQLAPTLSSTNRLSSTRFCPFARTWSAVKLNCVDC